MKFDVKTLCSVGALLLCSENALTANFEFFGNSGLRVTGKVSPQDLKRLSNMTSVKDLTLNDNKLEKFPLEITNLTGLTNLSIGNNNIASIPPEIKNLKNLRNLHAHHNKLKEIPPEIKDLKFLEHLCINDNNFPRIPDEVLFSTSVDNLVTSSSGQAGNQQILELIKERIENLNKEIQDVEDQLCKAKELVELQKKSEFLNDQKHNLKSIGASKRQKKSVRKKINEIEKKLNNLSSALRGRSVYDLSEKKRFLENTRKELEKSRETRLSKIFYGIRYLIFSPELKRILNIR